MLVSICLFRSISCGSVGFLCLMLFLCSMLVRMSCGSSLCLFFTFPCGMLCLSEVRIRFVMILLAVWMLSGNCVSVSEFSISSVNDFQSAFL